MVQHLFKRKQSVPKKIVVKLSPGSISEDFFLFDYAIFTNLNQFLLDLGLGLVFFGAD